MRLIFAGDNNSPSKEAPVEAPARGPPQAGFDFDQRVDDDWDFD
ncbi:MAG: hypothetical protein QNK52_06315 [Porticoccaceae bacterium]